MSKSEVSAIINILSFSHPHIISIKKEELWGFPPTRVTINRWNALEVGSTVFLYGEHNGIKGLWVLAEVVKKFESREPVKYWVQNPTGYPYQIKIRLLEPKSLDDLDKITPVKRDELISLFGVKILKTERFSIITFGPPKKPGITYSSQKFQEILNHFHSLNVRRVPERPEHDKVKEMIYQMGIIQGKFAEKECQIDNKRIDVVWKKTPISVPYIAFEIQFGGNLYEALVKLKHAYDLWNSIPVLVTDRRQIEEAKKWISGSFHEIKDAFKVLSWEDIKELYSSKMRYK
ncbi:MAG: hypothetical protein J7L07_04105, partial [Candidatus Odinarchaeota archaeon]|nr:hypothetical protein [Candidatus Odinarchaeota archaeon]